MYDIKQFRITLYLLLLLGFTGYAIAASAPAIWLIAVSGTIFNKWLFDRGRFKPMPRLVANLVTLAFAVFLVLRVKQIPGPPILAIGEFLILLQLVKLFEQRANRDLAQLLILSLLLMVSAAISTGSLLFGVLFVLYLFLSLYCCLLFHLKTETDHAKAVVGIDERKLNPMTLKQDQRFLTRSMRRLTGFVSAVAIFMAIFVFLFFPRGTGAGIIGNMAFKPAQAMTGFSDQVNFQDVARITQNETEVAKVSVTRDGEPYGAAGRVIYLRGSAPDTYVSDVNDINRWKWIRTVDTNTDQIVASRGQAYMLNPKPFGDVRYKQEIRLLPTGSDVLFAMPGAIEIIPQREARLKFNSLDQVIQLNDHLTGELPYVVISTGEIGPNPPTEKQTLADGFLPEVLRQRYRQPSAEVVRRYPVPARIKDFAIQDDVAGTDANGNLAQQRLATKVLSPLDELLANNFETYLKQQFLYTLDLTDARRIADQDPIEQFLYDFKRGHCEYFAGAMALMCQSVGMQARVVVGFKCDEFNSVGGYYIVRQSHAHAWVEVLTLKGWQTFDPTASREAPKLSAAASMWRKIVYFFDYLDYTWGNSVVNYDADSRMNLIQNVDSGLTNTAIQTSTWLQELKSWFDLQNFYWVSSGLLSILVGAMVCVIVVALGYFLYERIRLKKRARRIGLGQLPSSDQKRLARQLAFYDDLLRVLDRKQVQRPAHLTPMEFSQSIGYLPNEIYTAVQRLTRIFYRIRYGGQALNGIQQRRLLRVVSRIEESLQTRRS